MTNNRKTSSKPRKAPPLPYPFPRPALMQTWGEVQELKDLREALMKEYRADSTVVKILVHELAFYTWEIQELMNVRHELTRRNYIQTIKKFHKASNYDIDDDIVDLFIKKDPNVSREIDDYIKSINITPREIMITNFTHYRKQFEMIDVMLSAAERRRSQLLKELDRFEMARLLIAERQAR